MTAREDVDAADRARGRHADGRRRPWRGGREQDVHVAEELRHTRAEPGAKALGLDESAAGSSAPARKRSRASGSKSSARVRSSSRWKVEPSEAVMIIAAARARCELG